jgi:hypothetical protein
MNRELFQQRIEQAALSLWELGDLLGIHPHHRKKISCLVQALSPEGTAPALRHRGRAV